MKKLFIKNRKNIFIFLSYIFFSSIAFILIFFHRSDISFKFNWIIFWFYLLNLILAVIFFLKFEEEKIIAVVIRIIKKDFLVYMVVLLFAFIARFVLLSSYPYISLGDELRDPGYNALAIPRGGVDLFGFGSYQGYGNFIPLISYFFMFFLKISILIYRIPAAFIGILSVFLTYILTRIWTNRYIAFSAAFFLAASIKHIHYSRTELLMIMDSLLVVFILYAAYLTIKSWKGFFLLGISTGLIFHFYAGARAAAAITIVYLVIIYAGKIIKAIFREKGLFPIYFKETVLGLLLLISGFFMAIGPTINNLNINNGLSHIGTASLIIYDPSFQEKNLTDKFNFIISSYKTAFLVYSIEPSDDSHLKYYQPMLSFPVNLFFIFGLLLLFLKFNKNLSFSYLLLAIVMLNPFFNQVLINSLKSDHRLIGLMPILNIIAGYGFIAIINRFITSNKIQKIIVVIFVAIFSLQQLFFYFLGRPSDYIYEPNHYMFYSVAKYIKNDKNHKNFYILQDPKFDFSPLHFKEGFEFLDYPKTVQVVDEATFFSLLQKKDPKEGFIATQDTPQLNPYIKGSIIHNCRGNTFIPEYSCPLGFKGEYSFYVLDNTRI